jgi:hypothetical protein
VIVPRYWAESRVQRRDRKRQVTVRRFGWSDISEADAQAHADRRAHEAVERALAGDDVPRREPKLPYNGAEGVPIREEIVAEHGPTIITRNAYGARCLNTPDVLFADIDFETTLPTAVSIVLVALIVIPAVVLAWMLDAFVLAVIAAVIALLVLGLLAEALHRLWLRAGGSPEHRARVRIAEFVARHQEWSLRLYRTPAGMRLLATHRTFAPAEADVAMLFDAVRVDPVYRRMCLNQRCFRARVSAKPWRIGIDERLRPRPGVWPIKPERLPARIAWIDHYEAAARRHAACRLLETLGSGRIDPQVRDVVELHDAMCRAGEALPIA